jgi:molybdopterin-synthase adenylyltransferase
VTDRLERQSFLGSRSSEILRLARVAIIGSGGGGSHVVQQLAYAGFGDFLLVDPDIVEYGNLNRMVGATLEDAELGRAKTAVMHRVVSAVNPEAEITTVAKKWQEAAELLRDRDVVVGCVDSFTEREQIERTARRFLIPYLDIGMDVCEVEDGFSMGGQVVLSMPDGLCLRCYGILTDERLAQEARRYGAAGGRPQVVWANGVLASIAVGVLVQMFCPWRDRRVAGILREFDGESHTVSTSSKLAYLKSGQCTHFGGPTDIGDPFWKP